MREMVTVIGPGGEPVEVPEDPRWAPTTPGTMSWPPFPLMDIHTRGTEENPHPFPRDIATVQEGLEKLSQAECQVALDELMSRRPHNKTDLRHQMGLWRQDRTSWKNARDRREDKREVEE